MDARRGEPHRLPPRQFFARTARSMSFGGFTVTDARYPPALRVPEHSHAYPYFSLLVEGGYRETFDGPERQSYTPGSIVFHPAREVHAGEIATTGGRCFHLEIESLPVHLASERGSVPDRPYSVTGGPLSWLATRLFREFVRRRSASRLIMEGIALELVGELVRGVERRSRAVPPYVARAVELLNDRLSDSLTVQGLAAELGVAPVRLSRDFRRAHGEGVGEMHRRLRVERACELLAHTPTPLVDLALELGFADQSHFTRVFRGLTGLTPGRYRKLGRN